MLPLRKHKVKLGSPPRGRGKDGLRPDRWPRQGITPAQAGKRTSQSCGPRGYGDHPRTGGEKSFSVGMRSRSPGSPPRGRGKGGILAGRVRPKRITPAWAGKSPAGKNADKKLLGSPPRGRGKGVRSGVHRCCRWITPAQAGKSHPCRCGSAGVRDHPRTGGEKMLLLPLVDTRTGSPPRGRGKEIDRLHKAINNRITPAWAGKS